MKAPDGSRPVLVRLAESQETKRLGRLRIAILVGDRVHLWVGNYNLPSWNTKWHALDRCEVLRDATVREVQLGHLG